MELQFGPTDESHIIKTIEYWDQLPLSARRQLNDFLDELWTKVSIEFYKDGPDAVFKALVE